MSKGKKKQKDPKPISVENLPKAEPKPMSEEAIFLWTTIPEKRAKTVPPPTPTGIANALILPFPLPETFTNFDNFEVPYVRDVGIKNTIEALGQYLGCNDYSFDYIQFWLLDILTDCLWRTQDEYFFTKSEQKLVLEWILFIFKIVRDPTISCSKRKLFAIFKEAILMAGDLINEGAIDIPKPEEMFDPIFKDENEGKEQKSQEELVHDEEGSKGELSNGEADKNSDTESSSSFTISKDSSNHVFVVAIGDEERKYVWKKKTCECNQDSISSFGKTYTSDLTSTVSNQLDSSLKDEKLHKTNTETKSNDTESQNVESYEPVRYQDYTMFYQPDTKTPSRFLPLSAQDDIEKYILQGKEGEEDGEYEEEEEASMFDIIGDVFRVDSDYITVTSTTSPNDTVTNTVRTQSALSAADVASSTKSNQLKLEPSGSIRFSTPDLNEKLTKSIKVEPEIEEHLTDKQIMKRLKLFKLWEQRIKDMADSEKGWVPVEEDTSADAPNNVEQKDELNVDTRFALRDILVEEEDSTLTGLNFDSRTKNLGILCAIIELVFDYFYQNFHFALLKLSLKTNPTILTQSINKEWNVPKQIKSELVKPKAEKKKKEKKPKKEKKSKSAKASKKSKDKKKKDKKSKSSKGKSKASKAGKKKKEKPKKLTKEEKAELERQRKLQEEWEAEQRSKEENKRFMFPLADAGNDELYKNLFENWEKPKAKAEKGKKEKKGKKGKKK